MASESTPLPHFTCITCRVAFRDAEIQRSHYKTDWHRYNLKRKVAELPPVTAEVFQEKIVAQKEAAANAGAESKCQICDVCKKRFTSANSYNSHLRSKRHREMVAADEKREDETEQKAKDSKADQSTEDDKGEIVESDCEPEPLEITECLFCPKESDDMEQNLSHMSKSHGFFIPDLEYIIDIKGFISYLCEKVGMYYMCLHCNDKGKTFHSVESVQHHMIDKCHCNVFFEGDAAFEYAEFYDYTKSYPNRDKTLEAEGDDHDPIPEPNVKVNEDLELVLPSGSKIGHRALRQYYKQHLPTPEQRKSALITRLMSQYRALGWKGYEKGEGGATKLRDVTWAKKMQSARAMKLSVKANKLQPHLRPQVIF